MERCHRVRGRGILPETRCYTCVLQEANVYGAGAGGDRAYTRHGDAFLPAEIARRPRQVGAHIPRRVGAHTATTRTYRGRTRVRRY